MRRIDFCFPSLIVEDYDVVREGRANGVDTSDGICLSDCAVGLILFVGLVYICDIRRQRYMNIERMIAVFCCAEKNHGNSVVQPELWAFESLHALNASLLPVYLWRHDQRMLCQIPMNAVRGLEKRE